MCIKIKLLYVDDEPNNLNGFKASFRKSYQIFLAENTTHALGILEENPDIRIIFCDQRMPGKTGTEFFEEIKPRFPLPIRILITAYTDVEMVIAAINKGHIFKYIKKPWLESDVIAALEEANEFYITNSSLSTNHNELKRAYAELDKFVGNASHDLREPLTSVLTAIQVSRQMSDEKDIKELLGIMEKSVFRLEDYITSMHRYYGEQKGELKISNVNFNRLFDELKDVFGIYIDIKKIDFVTKVNQVGYCYSDEILIKMILNNLITNAIKYQKNDFEDKKIQLIVEVSDGTAEICVVDTGIGISSNHLYDIFKLHTRVATHGTGVGVGLYNVKNAVEKLQGKINVSSNLGEGTSFKLIIPSIRL